MGGSRHRELFLNFFFFFIYNSSPRSFSLVRGRSAWPVRVVYLFASYCLRFSGVDNDVHCVWASSVPSRPSVTRPCSDLRYVGVCVAARLPRDVFFRSISCSLSSGNNVFMNSSLFISAPEIITFIGLTDKKKKKRSSLTWTRIYFLVIIIYASRKQWGKNDFVCWLKRKLYIWLLWMQYDDLRIGKTKQHTISLNMSL